MSSTSENLTLKRIFIFWVPLAATWLMMAAEGPIISAIIARLAEPKINLAAYWVAYAFALIIEAPVIMMLSASTALVRSNQSFKKLRSFTYALSAGITIFQLILLIPAFYDFLTLDLMNLDKEVAHLTYYALIILIPWPGAIGYRRFYQGILIRNNSTRRVAYGTLIRLFSMITTAIILFKLGVNGAWVGAAALSVAVTMEAIASRIMVHSILKKLMKIDPKSEDEILTHGQIFKFYYPLALTSLIGLAVHPLVTFFLGQSRFALESLAVMSVINSLVFIFRSLGLSYLETAITFLGDKFENYKQVRKFGIILAACLLTGLALIAYTPFAHIWFRVISGLSEQLAQFCLTPTRILAIMPVMTVILSLQRAVLVNGKHTSPVTFATIIEVSGILTILILSIHFLNAIGAIAAAGALVLGRMMANGFLVFKVRGVLKKYR
jgi:Na+-driven multidrug efflux pump